MRYHHPTRATRQDDEPHNPPIHRDFGRESRMASYKDWALGRVRECEPSTSVERTNAVTSKVNNLLGALAFFENRTSQLFGMTCDHDKLEDSDTVAATCENALRSWLPILEKTLPDEGVRLYRELSKSCFRR
jgi:hypothetical protein